MRLQVAVQDTHKRSSTPQKYQGLQPCAGGLTQTGPHILDKGKNIELAQLWLWPTSSIHGPHTSPDNYSVPGTLRPSILQTPYPSLEPQPMTCLGAFVGCSLFVQLGTHEPGPHSLGQSESWRLAQLMPSSFDQAVKNQPVKSTACRAPPVHAACRHPAQAPNLPWGFCGLQPSCAAGRTQTGAPQPRPGQQSRACSISATAHVLHPGCCGVLFVVDSIESKAAWRS